MNAIDMSQFTQAKSDQFNAEDFLGGPRTFTVASVSASGNKEQPINVKFAGEDLYFRPCKTVRRIMVAIWGADASKYVGQSLTLYRDPDVKYGGMQVGGIRVSHMTGISEPTMVVAMEAQGRKKPIKIKPLAAQSRAPAAPAADPSSNTGSATQSAADPGPAVGEVAIDPEWAAWVEGAIGVILKKPDLASLARWQQAKMNEIVTLEADHKRLHAQLMQAINDRRTAIEASDEGAE